MAGETQPFIGGQITFVILPIFISINIFICAKIFRKFRYNIEPVHVFLMNYFGTLAFHILVNGIVSVLVLFPPSEEWCYEYNVWLASNMTFLLGIIFMQIDRFLAIYWNLSYANRVTTRKSILIVCLSPVIAVAASVAAVVVDRDYSRCIFPLRLVFTRTTNLTLLGSMKLLAIAASIVTSSYAVIIIIRQKSKNQVNPDQSIFPLPTISQPPIELRPVVTQRIDEDPNMFFLVKIPCINITEEIPVDEEEADIQFQSS